MKKLLLLLLVTISLTSHVHARCDISSGFDLITRACFECMFPLSIAAVPVMHGPMPDAAGPITTVPICECPAPPPLFVRIGVPLSMYNPNTVIEAVTDPMCMPSLGLDLGSLVPAGTLGGTDSAKNSTGVPRSFYQAHKLAFPMMYLLGLFLDSICFQQTDIDIMFLTEVDPSWNEDEIAAYLAPEALLFGNPVVALSCMADAVTAAAFHTLDPLFWCKGSHGMAYPMTGNVQSKSMVEDSASASENLLYHLHRLGLGTTPGLCFKIPTPIWRKADYRLQIIKPVPHPVGMTIGQTGLMWGMGKNPPYMGDNFVYLIFKKLNCCAF